jgi:HSP20 family protein
MILRELVPWQRRPLRREPVWDFGREVNRLFDEAFRGFDRAFDLAPAAGVRRSFEPRIDVEATAKELVVTAELPGLEEKDFEIHLEGDVLTLRGEKRGERGARDAGWFERSYGGFQRAIRLPVEVDADAATASFKDGVLRIALPRAREAEVRAIPVHAD